ncbi:hypothetical protein [Acinetobacter larvae]|uniref:Sulfatase-modifying factor enzyme domain-containing protein n=1 Tax=Acinetobacter larvae TaxID=1789224 RepID=A0A1B2M0K7_9GAMM|nr:hypothetical protein [Acinetobacter larvae]AOA58699.1 hypothetical protein BFG52_10265 [Acinetobacter larvae]
MVTILQRDALRNKVERESNGQQTVLYTQKGQPSYMNIIPMLRCEDLGDDLGQGPHPAFIVNDKVCDALFYGSYNGVIKDGELVSQPGLEPGAYIDFDTAVQVARANGQGWHLSTNAERALLMLWCQQQGWQQYGNTENGHCVVDPSQHGQRIDHGFLDYPDGNPATYTGSGPQHWRHDHSPYGIADLCGNIWEWQAGLRLVDGEIQIIADNNASHADVSVHSKAWMAVNLIDGNLVAPGHALSSKYDAAELKPEGNAGTPILNTEIIHRAGPIADNINAAGLMDGLFREISVHPSISSEVPPLLRALGLAPRANLKNDAQVYLRNYGERMFLAGGAWYSGLGAAYETLCLSHPRTQRSLTTGARPAFILSP